MKNASFHWKFIILKCKVQSLTHLLAVQLLCRLMTGDALWDINHSLACDHEQSRVNFVYGAWLISQVNLSPPSPAPLPPSTAVAWSMSLQHRASDDCVRCNTCRRLMNLSRVAWTRSCTYQGAVPAGAFPTASRAPADPTGSTKIKRKSTIKSTNIGQYWQSQQKINRQWPKIAPPHRQ